MTTENTLNLDEKSLDNELPPIPTSDDPGAPLAAPAQPGVAPAASVETGKMMAGFLDVTFNKLIAPKRGEHWRMDAGECDALGQAYGAVLDKWMPDFKTSVELNALVVTAAVIGPRLMITSNKQKKTGAPAVADPDIVVKGTGE